MSTPHCNVCSRDPKRTNSDIAECSHIQCPHRRTAWSERPTRADLFRGPWTKPEPEGDPKPLDRVENLRRVFMAGRECIEHKQKGDADGYGCTMVGRRTVRLHRLAYVEANNMRIEDIDGMVVRHKCDNPRCVNPAHLEIGTAADNNRDMVERGRLRTSRGVDHRLSKLTNDRVRLIRQRLAAGVPQREIAKVEGVSQSIISGIKSGKRWSHLVEVGS